LKEELIGLLVCPECKNKLDLYTFRVVDEKIRDGLLKCVSCNRCYFIIDFIPRMLTPDLYYNKDFIENYESEIRSLGVNIERIPTTNQNFLINLKKQTIKYFGFEWLEYGRFGWDDPIFNLKREEGVFRKKSLLTPQQFQGKLVLDAGCGNGRYSYWAAKYGAQVIGVDIGYGVESAYENTKNIENIHIIQGDIFSLPFPEQTFDIIFSIGVLMHTGNAKLATKSLVNHVKKDGIITVHMYHKGNPIYEFNDFMIRKVTTKLSIGRLISFTKMISKLAKFLNSLDLLKIINVFIRLENHPHCIFDWYSAPVATHHTYEEVYTWFDEFGLKVIKDNNTNSHFCLKRIISPPLSLTVSGMKV
jgi:SAM-dependent methyltransferase/uncharacterized protein YbaR (Trm112 family)